MIRNPNILKNILEFLDYRSLMNAEQVNRLFREIISDLHYWKRESISLFTDLSGNYYSIPSDINWAILFKQNLRVPIISPNPQIFHKSILNQLHEELRLCLKSPAYSFPQIRPEMRTFPTILQDAMANPHDLSVLSTHLSNQFQSALSSNTTEPDILKREIMQILSYFEQKVLLYCRIIYSYLDEIHDDRDRLGVYSDVWMWYSHSMNYFRSLFLPLILTLKQTFDTEYIVFAVMKNIWTTNVFCLLKNRLFAAILYILDDKRNKILNKKHIVRENVDLVKQFYESVGDISLDGASIFLKNHRSLEIDGPLQELNIKVIARSKEFYSKLDLGSYELCKFFYKDQKLLERSTYAQVYKTLRNWKLLCSQQSILDTLVNGLHSFRHDPEINYSIEFLTFSPIEEALLAICDDISNVKQFINRADSRLVKIYNSQAISIKSEETEF